MKRQDVKKELTWDLTDLAKDYAEFESKNKSAIELSKKLKGLKGTIKTTDDINKVTEILNEMYELLDHTNHYADLTYSVDSSDEEAFKLVTEMNKVNKEVRENTIFLEDELMNLDEKLLKEAMDQSPDAFVYLREIIKKKSRKLPFEVENALSKFSDTWAVPYEISEITKNNDIRFPDFQVNGKSYPMTFGFFEERYEANSDTDLRREAHKVFYEEMRKYQSTLAAVYNSQLKMEKAFSEVKGFDSVFDYLLDMQDISRESYEHHVDTIKNELPKVMRKYAKKIKEKYKLDKMTYADLKAPLMPEFEKHITIEASKDYLSDGLKILGDDYVDDTLKYIDNRWIDFAENEGKTTGAFCASVHNVHSYVLISWTGKMEDVFVLAHELGHAGHGRYTMRNNAYLNTESSMYVSECPSTMNEMIMSNYLIKNANDDETKNWVYTQMIERTYYYNFVTHGIEAVFQREVLRLIDKGESVNDKILNRIFRNVLEEFWGDEVEIIDGAELTWTRQPHYYMGLYPFTYQAGLSIATNVFKELMAGNENILKPYKEVLASGGQYLPKEWAEKLGVDIEGDFIKTTIDFIGEIVDKIN